MKYQTIRILKLEPYRSTSMVNKSSDMIRVTMTCSKNEWKELKQHIDNNPMKRDKMRSEKEIRAELQYEWDRYIDLSKDDPELRDYYFEEYEKIAEKCLKELDDAIDNDL